MPKSTIYIICFVFASIFEHVHAQIDVVAIGNSITAGSKSTNPYPPQLDILLGTNYSVINRGRESTTILKNGENTYWEVGQFEYAKATPHDIVIISFGTNATRPINWDTHSNEFVSDYLDLITEFSRYHNNEPTKYNEPVYILGLPPPIYIDGFFDLRNDILINEVIPKIKNVANQVGATIADFYHPMTNHPEWFNSDGIHPNAIGDSVMAKIVYNAIQTASTPDPPPDTPTGLKTISGLANVNLEWHANTEDDMWSYSIYRSYEMGGFQNSIGNVLKPDTTFSDNDVELNHIYYYSIDARDVHNNISNRSAAVAGKTIDNTPPDAPANLQVIQVADTIKLTWTPNSENDLSRYNIYRNIIEGNIRLASSIIGTVYIPKNDFIDISYVTSTNYYYGVTAVDFSGNQGLMSNIVNITTLSPPVSSDTTVTVLEDSPLQFSSSDIPFSDLDNHQLDKIIFLDSDNFEYFSYDSNDIDSTITCADISKLMFTPDLDEYGDSYAAFTFKVVDSFGSTSIDTNIVIINVASVNDVPHINPISDLYIMEDSHNVLLPLSGITAGPLNELQNLSIKAFAVDASLVKVSNINYSSPDDTGFVTIDPVENTFGIIPMTIQIFDDGGTSNGGVDSSETTFNINISPIDDKPTDFNIVTPNIDSTLVINKSNYLNTFSISWEASSDIENNDIFYNIIFSEDLTALSRYNLNSTEIEYILKDILAITDTVSIANGEFGIIASDGNLQTDAKNSGIVMIVDGRSFAPAKLHLDQNYPNPFNSATLIGFDLPKRANVTIIIYDLLGEEIIQLIDNKEYERGYNTITWNGIDKNNNLITTGIYIMQIRMDSVEQHKKLIFLK
ncbi:MAG: GDSL-type esterase/lipase family protein [Candidatus Neomarinimicrobiota bacterium]